MKATEKMTVFSILQEQQVKEIKNRTDKMSLTQVTLFANEYRSKEGNEWMAVNDVINYKAGSIAESMIEVNGFDFYADLLG